MQRYRINELEGGVPYTTVTDATGTRMYKSRSIVNDALQNEHICKIRHKNSSASRMNTIGLSAGGAKDINNFRENIQCGFMPQKSDITMEGIFYDYYFDTGGDQSDGLNLNHNLDSNNQESRSAHKDVLFYPTYSQGSICIRIHLYSHACFVLYI